MNPVTVPEWTAALRSGGYQQARGHLRSTDTTEDDMVRCCAIGVLLDVAGVDWQPHPAGEGLTVYGMPPLRATTTFPAWARPWATDGVLWQSYSGDSGLYVEARHLVELGEAGEFLACAPWDGSTLEDFPALIRVMCLNDEQATPFARLADLIDTTYQAWKDSQ